MAIDKQSISVPWPNGSKIKGRYEVLEIKHGGMASVYLCYDHEFQDYIAIKTFQDRFLKERSVVDRFLREAELWMRLEKHKNIVRVRWIDRINGRPCIFMEYIPEVKGYGSELKEWIDNRKLALDLSIYVAVQICTGMIYAQHKFIQLGQKFVHRDLKPANVMMTPDGSPKITDFGLAKIFIDNFDKNREHKDLSTLKDKEMYLSKVDEIFGSPPYMAPEQWHSSYDVDFRADIYSIGCILFEMITGRTPFTAAHIEDFETKHKSHYPKPFIELGIVTPSELENIVFKCLAKDPNDRFQSFENLRNELVQFYYNSTGKWLEFSDKAEVLSIADNSNIAMSLLELGKNKEAIEYYDRLLGQLADNLDPKNVARVFNNRGNCHSNMGDKEKALTNYELAIKIDADYDFPWYNSAGIYKDKRDYKKALNYATRAIELNPEYSPAHSQRAEILLKMGNIREAIYECGIAIKLDPSNPWAHDARAEAYEILGDFKNASIDRNKAKQLRGE